MTEFLRLSWQYLAFAHEIKAAAFKHSTSSPSSSPASWELVLELLRHDTSLDMRESSHLRAVLARIFELSRLVHLIAVCCCNAAQSRGRHICRC